MAGIGKEYVLGKGKLYFEQFIDDTNAGAGELFFGNVPEISYTSSTESLDHYDSTGGLNVKDDTVQTKSDWTGKFTTDNISSENLAIFFQSAGATNLSQTSGTGLSETFTVMKGRFYQLGKTTQNPVGARNVTVTSVVVGASGATVLDTDYAVTASLGRIQVLPDSPAIDDGDTVTVTYSVAAATLNMVVSGSLQIKGRLVFLSDNPKGSNRDYVFPYVTIKPDGDFALIGDDWLKMGFSFEILKLADQERAIAVAR